MTKMPLTEAPGLSCSGFPLLLFRSDCMFTLSFSTIKIHSPTLLLKSRSPFFLPFLLSAVLENGPRTQIRRSGLQRRSHSQDRSLHRTMYADSPGLPVSFPIRLFCVYSSELTSTSSKDLDYVCPFSAKMFNTLNTSVLPTVPKKYSGKVQFLFRQQIQPWHPSSTLVVSVFLA